MQHKFKHEFVEPIKMSVEEINGKRHYIIPTGEKFKSVTTILGERLDKSGLIEWQKQVGEIEAAKILRQAGHRGTAFHSIAEKYLLNDESFLKDQMPVDLVSFKSIRRGLDENIGKIYGIEIPLYSRSLGCAGRTDVIAEYSGINSIIDFKTSKKIKSINHIEGYFLQSTVYSMMFEYLYRIKIPQIVVIIAVDFEKPQIFVEERSKYVNRVIEVFR